MGSCGCDKELLLEFAFGEIEPQDLPIVQAQVRSCPECARDLEQHRQLAADLRARPEAEFPADLREVLVRSAIQIRRDARPAWVAPRVAPVRPRFSWTPVLCAGAGLAIVAVLVFFLLPGGSSGSMDEMVFGGSGRGGSALDEVMELVSNVQRGWELAGEFLGRFAPVARALQASVAAVGFLRWAIFLLSIVGAVALLWRVTRAGHKRGVNHV